MNQRRRFFAFLLMMIITLFGCGPSAEQAGTMIAAAWTITPTATLTATPTITLTVTPTFTLTVRPTSTRTATPTVETVLVARIRWSNNGHLYEVIRVPDGIHWEDANQAAQALGGHLVTITSAAENNFVFSIAASTENRHGFWLGGYQLQGSSEPDGGWVWVTGEPWNYTCWDDEEPNNSDGNEDRLHFHWENGWRWNDLSNDDGPLLPGSPRGFIVEYE